MIDYNFVKLDKKDFDDIYIIMREAFPTDERRAKEHQKSIMENKLYSILGIRNEEELIGFLAFWNLKDVIFIEHLAVKNSYRNKKIGKGLLQYFLKINKKKIILEVEPPEDELKKRRIEFYKRCGFVLNDYDYMQPSYEKWQKSIPLNIMSYPDKINKKIFINDLYKEVYGI